MPAIIAFPWRQSAAAGQRAGGGIGAPPDDAGALAETSLSSNSLVNDSVGFWLSGWSEILWATLDSDALSQPFLSATES